MYLRLWFIFFFSSRRRHTRLQGDWSSDVCSSDLLSNFGLPSFLSKLLRRWVAQARNNHAMLVFVNQVRLKPMRFGNPEQSVGGKRSEEHTSELQSPCNLVCRLLLEKKKTIYVLLASHEHRFVDERMPPKPVRRSISRHFPNASQRCKQPHRGVIQISTDRCPHDCLT